MRHDDLTPVGAASTKDRLVVDLRSAIVASSASIPGDCPSMIHAGCAIGLSPSTNAIRAHSQEVSGFVRDGIPAMMQ